MSSASCSVACFLLFCLREVHRFARVWCGDYKTKRPCIGLSLSRKTLRSCNSIHKKVTMIIIWQCDKKIYFFKGSPVHVAPASLSFLQGNGPATLGLLCAAFPCISARDCFQDSTQGNNFTVTRKHYCNNINVTVTRTQPKPRLPFCDKKTLLQ